MIRHVPQIKILRPSDPLGEVEGNVVVLDVFRASNTILSLLAAGVPEILLVADLEAARALRQSHPDWPLLGERGGVAPSDFDGGNSPAAARPFARSGRPVILTTSAGTQAVHRLHNARRVFYGSFANVSAVARMLAQEGSPASVLPMGLEGRIPAVEDDLAAEVLCQLTDDKSPDFAGVRSRALRCAGADRLRRLGQHDDLEFCTLFDSHELVPEVHPGDPPRARSAR